ncbi:MAG: phosphate starvation-inducible protein PhoH [Flavobacteriaceae bacterium]|nr:MAG: phosphate starvation-inducible protein PhoH [Flavobacteriaceae bacterium]
MTELKFDLEQTDIQVFYGESNKTFDHFKSFFPKLKIVGRGSQITAIGQSENLDFFGQKLSELKVHILKYNSLTNKDLEAIVLSDKETLSVNGIKDVLVHGVGGKMIKPKTPNQKKLVELSQKYDLNFAIGPAGTGKTYTSVALAVKALKEKSVKRIILTRPAVEAGENLGFLPGDLKDKLDPYLRPLYDALNDMIPHKTMETLVENNAIEVAPLAFMRGRTLDHAFVILDEAQNTTASQMKMFLTRMGKNAKFIICGDPGQVDLPKNQQSGLKEVISILKEVQGIGWVYLDGKDVVRHPLVTKILKAYQDKNEIENPPL